MNETDIMKVLENAGDGVDDFLDVINQIMSMPDDQVNDQTVNAMKALIDAIITSDAQHQAAEGIIAQCRENGYGPMYLRTMQRQFKAEIDEFIEQAKLTEAKKEMLYFVFGILTDMYDMAIEMYGTDDMVLPIKLEEGAHVPTYAHSTDAAADIYALEDMTLAPHSLSNVVHTGLRIALPEGWAAYILPRSSIGMKSGLRLSNSVGVIDSEYRGEIGVMYDNHSDSDYRIHKGDRIAQMIVMPVHQFKPQVVDTLDETSRGEGGFGSTGK